MIRHPANAAIDDWLAAETPEEVLEPELPIVDPHHHLWDLRSFTSQPHASFEQKVYLCEEMTADLNDSGHNIEQTVFAQCEAFYRADGEESLRCVGETEFVAGIAAMSRSGVYGPTRLCTGIFASADLRMGAGVEPVLAAHLSASDNFRGIRSAFPSDLNDNFLEGYQRLARHQLSFDNYSPDYTRLETLARLASRVPDVPVIVNHLGGHIDPEASRDDVQRWRAGIDAVAKVPNVYMKCGGAQQRVGSWEPPFHMQQRKVPISSSELVEQVGPFYRYAIDAFGPQRCMFESNFPVDKECVSYRTLWNAFKLMAADMGLSDGDKAQIFAATARAVYRLDELQ
jgi:predicted TIM-barrel fold metal-dependent hydrolase